MTTTPLKADEVDECGWLVKGWSHSEDVLREATKEWDADYPDSNVVDWYERREIWVRKAQMGPPGGDYAWYMQETEPHARGAGRFTFIDMTRPIKTGGRGF